MDVVYRIHNSDIFSQNVWYTRVLYNAYPPFRLNFVLDTHVFPCDQLAVKELFDLFNATDVDISFGNRQNKRLAVMGAAALFRAGKGSHFFWKTAYHCMRTDRLIDDQNGMGAALSKYGTSGHFKFRWLSFNWAFASHGVLPNGMFKGSGKCYRTSLTVNGPVRFVHGKPEQCVVMNGVNREYVGIQRCYFAPRSCKTGMKKEGVALNLTQFKAFVYPYKEANLHWNVFKEYSPTDIFWPERQW